VTPLNRAELLDYLQEICGGDCFRRQTYYLAQSYVDQVLSRQDHRINKFQLLGITALFMAAKMEELEPQVAPKFAKYTSDFCSAKEICTKEREIVQLLNWRLNPDTLYFWMEYYIRMWDQFVVLQGLDSSFSIKKKSTKPFTHPVGPLGLDEREFLSTAEDKNQSFFQASESFSVENRGNSYRRII
jgi:cyclin E